MRKSEIHTKEVNLHIGTVANREIEILFLRKSGNRGFEKGSLRMAKGKKIACCFMNRKSCIYERAIQNSLDKPDDGKKTAFVIMPFEKRLDALYQWEIAPFLLSKGYRPERADEVNRIGYIICEKICKRIQEADLVVVDISFNNPNVFYEMGLAMALRKPLLTICCEDKLDEQLNGRDYAQIIQDKYSIKKKNILQYPKFGVLEVKDEEFNEIVIDDYREFERSQNALSKMSGEKIIVLDSSLGQSDAQYSGGVAGEERGDKKFNISSFNFNFLDFCKSAAGNAISKIFDDKENSWVESYGDSEKKEILSIRDTNLNTNNMRGVFEDLSACCCAIIDITENRSANYFWLGYIHGIGGNVIPINRKDAVNSDFPPPARREWGEIPFDIRALWHILYDEANPLSLSDAFVDILEIIYEDKAATKNRDAFWESILTDSEVSIFLGSYRLEELGRNSIGDWDYRAASEITSFLTSKKETIKVTLASPLPKRGFLDGEGKAEKYIEELKEILRKGGNCIIIATPDVNDLTEVALCSIYDLHPFKEIPDNDNDFYGFIARKVYNKNERMPKLDEKQKHAFYSYDTGDTDERGFLIRRGRLTLEPQLEHHKYPGDTTGQVNTLLGQLIVANNPLCEGKKIIILSGISGPSTFGIAQLLTGGVYDEFTVNYLKDTNADSEANAGISAVVADYMEQYAGDSGMQMDADAGAEGRQKKFFHIARDKDGCAKDFLIDYKTLSENLIQQVTDTFNKNKEYGCTAIIDVGVYYPPSADADDDNSKDERKIIAFKYSDLSEKANRLENPLPIEVKRG
jgi:hypothetical protein